MTQAAQRWDPAAEVDRASATLLAMGQAVVSFVIVFAIVWLPLILFVLVDRRGSPGSWRGASAGGAIRADAAAVTTAVTSPPADRRRVRTALRSARGGRAAPSRARRSICPGPCPAHGTISAR